ncbi:THUMP domain protein [Aspergillus terreus]|uniref:THUMP domain protein n=1 Tax=Aspergillus terreus TaxID=33178 RepID=A0A5M3YPU6_ASPTE|nr:hypothetical protein ATETN484_0002063300 [Aspergillus terreus]GFF15489.1 THUMP domain protein [Aspergillus terreus]
MAGTGKRPMPEGASAQSSKKRKGASKWLHQQPNKAIIESGDWGVFVTCDKGREGKCIAETLDLFSQWVETSKDGINDANNSAAEEEDEDIEAQIRKEVEGLKPGASKSPQFRAIRIDMPCVTFIRFDKSIAPEKMVHDICIDAYENPERKRTRFLQRMTPVHSIRKTLNVDLEVFAKDILAPHFHSGGPPRKFAIRPSIRANSKFKRDDVIKTVARVVGPGHSVDLKNYDLLILVEVAQNVIGMSVVGSDYDKLKRYNLAELYKPATGSKPSEPTESTE